MSGVNPQDGILQLDTNLEVGQVLGPLYLHFQSSSGDLNTLKVDNQQLLGIIPDYSLRIIPDYSLRAYSHESVRVFCFI